MKPIIIIGNGVAGVTAARELRKRDTEVPIIIISGETDHHKPYEDHFWVENRIELKRGWVKSIDHEAHTITLEDGNLEYRDLVLAVGSTPNKFGWPGQDLPGVQGLYSKQDLDAVEESAQLGAKHAVITGGGLIGIEMAEMLVSRGIGVSFLVREDKFWGAVIPDEEAEMIEDHIREHHIDLRMGEEMDSVFAGEDGRAAYVTTKNGEKIECQIVGLTAGVRPNIDWLKEGSEVECERGIMVDEHFKTNLPNIWAIGDCAQLRTPPPGRRPIEAVWYVGKIQGAHVAANILGDTRTYDPGIWWNSAKFLDIEYQTYGTVLPQPPEGEKSFDDQTVVGVNTFGIRHRHQVWEHWLSEKATITEVLSNLAAANFDPEFFTQYEDEIINHWNINNTQQVTKQITKGLFTSLLTKLNLFQKS